MNPDEIKKWLMEEEYITYEIHAKTIHASGQATSEKLIKVLESLAEERQQNAEYRRLMKKHEWTWTDDSWGWLCIECGAWHKDITDDMPHKSDCLWAKAIHTDGLSGTIGPTDLKEKGK